VEEIRQEHDGEARGQQHGGHGPETNDRCGHSADSFASPFGPPGGFARRLHVPQLVPGTPRRLDVSPIA